MHLRVVDPRRRFGVVSTPLRSKKPKGWAVALTATVLAGGLGLAPGFAFAGSITSGPTPNTGIAAGTVMTVKYTSSDTNPTGFISFVECGNANSSGAALTAIAQGDCVGTENLLQNGAGGAEAVCNGQTGVSGCVTNPSGQPGITSGTQYTASLTSIVSNIGSDKAKCLPVDGTKITLPCEVEVQEIISCGSGTVTVCTSGFGPVPGTLKTATFTAAGSTAPPPTTTAPTTAPPTTAPPTTASGSGASSGGSSSSGSTTSTTLGSSSLANTGPHPYTWILVLLGLALLDLGYLAVSATWRRRSASGRA